MYGKVSRSFFLSFLFYIGHGVAAICQFVEIRRHRGSRGIQLGCARLARWQKQRRARLYRCPFPHQLDRQAIQHLHSLTLFTSTLNFKSFNNRDQPTDNMSNFDPNAILRRAQLTIVGGTWSNTISWANADQNIARRALQNIHLGPLSSGCDCSLC